MNTIAVTHLVIYYFQALYEYQIAIYLVSQTDILKSAFSDDFSIGRHLLKNNKIVSPLTRITDVYQFYYVWKYCTYLIHTFLDMMK